ncbi:helix-turn-helix transcriptional regulator [Paraburkholderia sp. RP-4-7]|uniref:Helix-turn-helix transcriptional regulator n=4 Tax=Paraburkholderia TaxID=1822464 RepID=A0A848IKL2_9BURK|nr:helix-turn-helix transcriptional regulator [Paraburkholderia polaris]
MNMGQAIKMCRTRRSLSQAELAGLAGCSISYLSMLESNQRDPSLSTLKSIAGALRIPTEILFFLGSDREELAGMDKELSGQLARAALEILSDTHEPVRGS